MTTPIAKNPTRVFPLVIDELADTLRRRAGAALRPRAAQLPRAAERVQPLCPLGAAQKASPRATTVCLLMPNRPEFMAIWLGITRVGGVVALLNTNLAGPSLAHCINIVAPKHIIVAAELADAFATARPQLKSPAEDLAAWRRRASFPRIDREIEGLPGDAAHRRRARRAHHRGPRALHLHLRHHRPAEGREHQPLPRDAGEPRLRRRDGHQPTDRMYDCLPMYHTAGGVLATGAVLLSGGSVVMREKFSAREFWDDVVRYDCTLFQYIGELCRYLAHSPPHPERDQAPPAARLRQRPAPRHLGGVQDPLPHPADPRVLRRDRRQRVDVQFRGQAGRGRPHAVVRRAPLPDRGGALRRRDAAAGAQRRRLLHRCGAERARRGDRQDRQRRRRSPATASRATPPTSQNENKILRDVFEKGDAWFRTGDLMRKDDRGYFYFVDRIGDTFRWKGENVSTTRGRRGDQQLPRHRGRQRLWRHRCRPRRPRRHGGDRLPRRLRPRGAARAPAHPPAGLRAAAVPAHPEQDRRHRHLQAEEGRSGEARASIRRRSPTRSISTIRSARPSCGSIRRSISASRAARSGCDRSSGRSGAGVLARGRAEQVVQEGRRRSTRQIRARFLATYEPAVAGPAFGLGATPPRARSRSSSCSTSFPATCSAAARAPSPPIRWPAPSPTARWRAASTAAWRRPTGSSSTCRSSTRNRWPTRSAASRCSAPPGDAEFPK